MKLVIFDLRGPLAHFRRPDTLATHATYPFITRTALRGLAASVLGLQSLPADVRCGLRLLAPVRTVAQEMTMHGKTWTANGSADSLRRPTAIELVVNPHYRIYYVGQLADELGQRLRKRQSHYHTYLGSAYCLTFPEWVREETLLDSLAIEEGKQIDCISVVPSAAVHRLFPAERDQYARVGGVLWEHLGDRCFRGSTSLLYEIRGRALRFLPAERPAGAFWQFHEVAGEGVVCLW